MLKKDLPACPVELTLLLISNKWKILIIRDLLEGTKRFSELKKSITNISQKVLTSNLREMEENGLLSRKVYPNLKKDMIKISERFKILQGPLATVMLPKATLEKVSEKGDIDLDTLIEKIKELIKTY